jgi:hypothetical protein
VGKSISITLSSTTQAAAAALAMAWTLNVSAAFANDVSIVSYVNGEPIVVAASADRYAGAIDSVTFRGVEYINNYDHGRSLSVALQPDGLGECYNPTEPGSYDDASNLTSSSILLSISNASNVLTTQTNMVNWLRPGEASHTPCSGVNPPVGVNPTYISNYILSKTVSFYGSSVPNLFIDNISISVPDTHYSTNTEAATPYLPSQFSVFLNYDRMSGTLTRLAASANDPATGSIPQALRIPVIVAVPDGTSAMGMISSSTYDGSSNQPYYDYFRFPGPGGPNSKLSCVFGGGAVQPGSILNYTCGFAVGSVDEVISAMNAYPDQDSTKNIPVYRFYDGARHFFTKSYNEGSTTGYSFETTAFHLFQAGVGNGYYPLYRCYNVGVGDHFISTQSNCDGFAQEGIYGYAAPTAQPGLYPLYRFFRGGTTADHLETINYAEGANNGYTYEGILGYVAS